MKGWDNLQYIINIEWLTPNNWLAFTVVKHVAVFMTKNEMYCLNEGSEVTVGHLYTYQEMASYFGTKV